MVDTLDYKWVVPSTSSIVTILSEPMPSAGDGISIKGISSSTLAIAL